MIELVELLQAQGFTDFEPILDGTIHRFDHHGTGTGWFIGWEKQTPYFIYAEFGDWKTGEHHIFKTNVDKYSDEDKKLIKEEIDEKRKANEERKKDEYERAKEYAGEKWENGGNNPSPYLDKKGFGEYQPNHFGLKTHLSPRKTYDLLVPLKDIEEKLWSIQRIQDDGQKFFQSGGRVRGLFHALGTISEKVQKIYITEGIATAISIHLATNMPTICAFNAGNLEDVAKAIRKKYPHVPIIICGDDDRFTIINGSYKNTGKEAARRAAAVCQGVPVFPEFKNPDSTGTDFNDLHMEEDLASVLKQLSSIALPNPKLAIKTQSTGFHIEKADKAGNVKYIPQYDDITTYFKKLYDYKLLDTSELFLVWNGKQYVEKKKSFLKCFGEEYFFPKPTNHIIDELVSKLTRQGDCVRSSDWFLESSKNKLNFNNIVFDKETSQIEPHNSHYGFRYTLNYNFDPNAACPVFDKFLKDITKGDGELEKVILEFMGYALSNDECWLEKALVLEGEGSNGKSTLSFVLKELAGKASYSTFSIDDLDRPDNRANMDGKLFNIAEEMPNLKMTETAIFKDLSSGGSITARPLFKEAYVFHNKTKLIFACNDLPRTRDTSYGLMRKIIIIPFRARFDDELGNKDNQIRPKLKNELSGIFNRVWAAYKECKKRGSLTHSKEIKKSVDAYSDSLDPLKVWAKENIAAHILGNGMDEKFQAISKLFFEYKTTMEKQGEYALSYSNFCRKLVKIVPDYEKRKTQKRVDGKMEYVLIGITQTSQEEF